MAAMYVKGREVAAQVHGQQVYLNHSVSQALWYVNHLSKKITMVDVVGGGILSHRFLCRN